MILEKEKAFFKIYCWCISAFCFYLIIYVFVMRMLKQYGIQFHCPYLKVTGQECPLCGMTRDFWNVFSFSSERLNSLTDFVVLAFAMEVLYRGGLFFMWKNSAFWNHIRILNFADAGGHLLILLSFAAFCISSL